MRWLPCLLAPTAVLHVARLPAGPAPLPSHTGLEELSLAGNRLAVLPPEIGALTSLSRLQLAGNSLAALPQGLCQLSALQGLWLHGNLLESLPGELGALTALTQLSLSGNRLRELPASIGGLVHLQELSCAGNQLQALPSSIGGLAGLSKLHLHGNLLRCDPVLALACAACHLGTMRCWQPRAFPCVLLAPHPPTHTIPHPHTMQGAARKRQRADALGGALPAGQPAPGPPARPAGRPASAAGPVCGRLRPGSSAGIAGGGAGAGVAVSLWQPAAPPVPGAAAGGWMGKPGGMVGCMGATGASGLGVCASPPQNNQEDLALCGLICRPEHTTDTQAPKLKTLWLEGNPLTPEAVAALLGALPSSGVTALGLDERQLGQLPLAQREALVEAAGRKLRVSRAVPAPSGSTSGGGGSSPGYFKLEPAPAAASAAGNGSSRPNTEVLVVSFGSAPGTPNWGGLLKKVRAAAVDPQEQNFDVLYVVDPHRSWYRGEQVGE